MESENASYWFISCTKRQFLFKFLQWAAQCKSYRSIRCCTWLTRHGVTIRITWYIYIHIIYIYILYIYDIYIVIICNYHNHMFWIIMIITWNLSRDPAPKKNHSRCLLGCASAVAQHLVDAANAKTTMNVPRPSKFHPKMVKVLTLWGKTPFYGYKRRV